MTDNTSSKDFDSLLDEFIKQQLEDTEDVLAEINDESSKKRRLSSDYDSSDEKNEITENNQINRFISK